MALNETTLTIVGNLTGDPELRYTPAGDAVASFTVASTPRTFDRQAGEWRDGDALFLRCTAWRALAEHAAESLRKGARVITVGRLRQRSFEVDSGERRSVTELVVEELGVSLRFGTATVTTTPRTGPAEPAATPAGSGGSGSA